MAKKLKSKDEVEEVEVIEEVAEEPTKEATKDVEKANKAEKVEEVEEAKVTINAQPTVKIRLSADVNSYIGCTFYCLKAGVEYNVPKNVKDILKQAGYLEAL